MDRAFDRERGLEWATTLHWRLANWGCGGAGITGHFFKVFLQKTSSVFVMRYSTVVELDGF